MRVTGASAFKYYCPEQRRNGPTTNEFSKRGRLQTLSDLEWLGRVLGRSYPLKEKKVVTQGFISIILIFILCFQERNQVFHFSSSISPGNNLQCDNTPCQQHSSKLYHQITLAHDQCISHLYRIFCFKTLFTIFPSDFCSKNT